MAHEKIEISNLTRETIVNMLVEPYYKDMIKTTISGKKLWRLLGISLETSSKIMVALGGIFSFSAGYYHDDTLSFVAGSISCMSLALLQIASFSYKENKKQGEELNILLKKLNLDTIPSMVRSEDQTTIASARYMSPRSLPPYPIQRSNSFTNLSRQPLQNRDEDLKMNEIKTQQQREYELQQIEYQHFIEFTQKANEEIQKLDRDLDEKMSRLQEKEESLKERERNLNLLIVKLPNLTADTSTDASVDTIDNGASVDTIDNGASADTIDNGASADTIDNGASADTIDNGANEVITILRV
jgi:hypothetical protein